MQQLNRWLPLLTVSVAWFALGLQLFLLIDNELVNGMNALEALWRFLAFFTILSNLLVAGSLSILLLSPHSSTGRFFNRPAVISAIALYIFIVSLVYNILLRNTWHPEGWQKVADELLHVVVPLLYLLYWWLIAPKKKLAWTKTFTWLLFPAGYLAYALTRGYFEKFYPYPFIDADHLGYPRVALNSAGLMLIFIVAGLLFIALGNLLGKNASPSPVK